METIEMLRQLCQSYGVAGEETQVTECARTLCQNLGEISQNVHGSLLCKIRPAKENGLHLVLNAHLDEIGLIVTAIDENGFLKVAKCGGVDRRLVMASAVVIHVGENTYPAVIGSVPLPLQSGEKKNPKLSEIYIDAGLTKKQATEKIPLGSRISFEGPFTPLCGGLLASKALDDRCGCAAVILAAQRIVAADSLGECGLSLLLSTQEETGGLGATTGAFALRASQSIVVDVTFGTTPEIAEFHCGELKKGPMIGAGPLLDRKMTKALEAVAKEHLIPYQIEAMGGHTGTDADGIAAVAGGVPCACVSIPLRYMHTAIEVIAVEDVEHTANLLAAYAAAYAKI